MVRSRCSPADSGSRSQAQFRMLSQDFGLAIEFAFGFQPPFMRRAFAVELEPAAMRVIQREVLEPRPAEPLLKRGEIFEVIAPGK